MTRTSLRTRLITGAVLPLAICALTSLGTPASAQGVFGCDANADTAFSLWKRVRFAAAVVANHGLAGDASVLSCSRNLFTGVYTVEMLFRQRGWVTSGPCSRLQAWSTINAEAIEYRVIEKNARCPG